MPFHLDRVGEWSAPYSFVVTAEAIAEFADATNDPHPEHRQGLVAPAGYAWVPAWRSGLCHTVSGDVIDLTPEEILRVVHGEHDLHIGRPIREGDALTLRGRVLGVFAKGSGTTVVQQIDTRDAVGDLVNTQYATAFYRGVSANGNAGSEAPAYQKAEQLESGTTIVQTVDPDQPERYARASGDHTPIHLDADVARATGLPGIIAHGLCMFAFMTQAATTAVGDGDPGRLRRIGVRFARPVLPGDTLATTFNAAGGPSTARRYGFSTTNGAGETVLVNGHVEMAVL